MNTLNSTKSTLLAQIDAMIAQEEALMQTEQAPTMMTSFEIAQLTGKEHFHIMRDIKKMMTELEINPDLDASVTSGSYRDAKGELEKMAPNLDASLQQGTYLDSMNRPKPMMMLDMDMTLTLVSGYNATLRHAVIKRWRELESFVRSEPVRALAVEANILTPVQEAKIAAYEQVMEADDTNITLREMAKLYGIAPVKFNELLASWGYIFRQGGKWQPRSGYSATCGNPAYVYFQTKMLNVGGTARVGLWITPQGVARIGKVLTEAGFQNRVAGQMISSL